MALADDRPEVGGRRWSAGAAENGGRNCSRNKKTFHDDNRLDETRQNCRHVPSNAGARQIKKDALVKRETTDLLNVLRAGMLQVTGCVSGNRSTIVLVIAFTMSTWSFMVTYL